MKSLGWGGLNTGKFAGISHLFVFSTRVLISFLKTVSLSSLIVPRLLTF